MESETENQDHTAYNNFFYATVCHVCKRFNGDVLLMRCSGCFLISYCSVEHQMQHREQHELLCNVATDLFQPFYTESCDTPLLEWEEKLSFKRQVRMRMGRRLEIYEKQMIMFPRECIVCNKPDSLSLIDCRDCAASFCEDHIDSIQHKDICGPLGLCFKLNLSLFNVKSELTLCYFERTSTFQDMNGFIDTCVNLNAHPDIAFDFLKYEYSQHLFRPLTLFHAMRLLDYSPKRKDLIIHVVNATQADVDLCAAWNMLIMLKLIDVSSLIIVMIGPEFECRSHALPESERQEKECLFEFHVMTYYDYTQSPSFVIPNLVIGFDSHIKPVLLKSCEEIWALTIPCIALIKCPFVLTSCTQEYLDVETQTINILREKNLDYIYKGKNPFASLRPHRGIGSQKVFYMSQYLVVYKNLWG
ncbi:PREDICTED: uncharacterized protein LOC105560499 [Vollenhovia emeryi]|uniref:uncharacterized protein LOC105560499 n=1 Tax=Vollenhovia emeryi TaxID=411798 RepID=UPI0005F4B1D6|nr:PREDICTED: uncharacterized protein LOC105560499 [Vollenhovia emeryi]